MRSARLASTSGAPWCSGRPNAASSCRRSGSGSSHAGRAARVSAVGRPSWLRRFVLHRHELHRPLGPMVGDEQRPHHALGRRAARPGGRTARARLRRCRHPRRATAPFRARRGSPLRRAAARARTPARAASVRCRRSRSSNWICAASRVGSPKASAMQRVGHRVAHAGFMAQHERQARGGEPLLRQPAGQRLHQALRGEDEHRGVIGAVQQLQAHLEACAAARTRFAGRGRGRAHARSPPTTPPRRAAARRCAAACAHRRACGSRCRAAARPGAARCRHACAAALSGNASRRCCTGNVRNAGDAGSARASTAAAVAVGAAAMRSEFMFDGFTPQACAASRTARHKRTRAAEQAQRRRDFEQHAVVPAPPTPA